MKILMDDKNLGHIALREQYLDPFESHKLLTELKKSEWSNHKILMFGKWISEPRKVSFYGDEGISYTYSRKKMVLQPWTPLLKKLKDRINSLSDKSFNSVLINYYRNGDDYMGWHSDNETELGENPHICSLSLGQERDFVLRLKSDHTKKLKILLQSGDLLFMQDHIQELWEHSLPKRKRAIGERINLTFREIIKI